MLVNDSGHNTARDWWLLFALPNGLWIVFPLSFRFHPIRFLLVSLLTKDFELNSTLLAILFGAEIAKSLRIAAKEKKL
jgi:hypothetical protein